MAYVIPKIEDILDDNDLNDNLARAKNRAAVLRAEKASLEADKASGKKYDTKRLSEVSLEVTDLDDFISREPTVRNKVAQQVADKSTKQTEKETAEKTKKAEADFGKAYNTELGNKAVRGGKPDFDILAGLTPEQRQLIDTSNTGKGYGGWRNTFNAVNPVGLAWMFGDNNAAIQANARGMANFERFGSAGFEGSVMDQDLGLGTKLQIPGGVSSKEYLSLIAAGGVDTLAQRTGLTPTDIPAASAAGVDPKVSAQSDYDQLVAQKAAAEQARRQAADLPPVNEVMNSNAPGSKRLFSKNLASPLLQTVLGTGLYAYNTAEGGDEYTSEAGAFDDEARGWIRGDVENRRLKSQEVPIKEFQKKQKKSQDVISNALFPIMGTGLKDYSTRNFDQVAKGIMPNYKDGTPGGLKVAGISGDKEVMDMALRAADAYEKGDEEGFKQASNINSDLNTKLAAMGFKSRTPVIIGGFNREKSADLASKGAAILIPNEDGQGYRIMMIPVREGRFGTPYDTSRAPESLPDATGLGSNFTIEEYKKLAGAPEALAAAQAERDRAATPADKKPKWKYTPTP